MAQFRRKRKTVASPVDDPSETDTVHGYSKSSMPALGLAALGIVFGDIGTSPLYTLKTVLDLTGGAPNPATILATQPDHLDPDHRHDREIRFVAMSIDNDGEGGILL